MADIFYFVRAGLFYTIREFNRMNKKPSAEIVNSRLLYEEELWGNGIDLIAGVDEVGRGCLFGPVVAAACILPKGLSIPDVRDSKQLTAKQRDSLYERILSVAVAYSVSIVSVELIEKINIKQASRLAMKQAVDALRTTNRESDASLVHVVPDWLLVDAETIDLAIPQTAIIKGDDRSQSIGAASILAKVTRDRMALEWAGLYPGYGLASNKGYASRQHFEGLNLYGPTPMHRATFLRKWQLRQLTLFDELNAASEDVENG